MAQYLVDDRRCKQEGEHLRNVVKVRFTDGELAHLEQAAAMTTEGRLAPLLHDLALEGLRERERHQAQLLDDLAHGRELDATARDALATLLAHSATRRLMDSVAQTESA